VLALHETPACEVSLLLTGDDEIRELNKAWRGIDAPTDVLSFAQNEEEDFPATDTLAPLGDVVISVDTAARQAQDLDRPLDSVMAHLVVHGTLHLLGYDHRNARERHRMQQSEANALRAMGLEPVLWEAAPGGGLRGAAR
jgi:probable rRNA maturation factor